MKKKEDLIIIEYKLRTCETLPSDKRDKKSKFAILVVDQRSWSDGKLRFPNGELIGLVNSPAYDGARLLVKLGYDPDKLMTTRAMDSQHYFWTPQPIHKFAKLTVKERDKSGLAVEPFIQFPGVGRRSPLGGQGISTYQKDMKPLCATMGGSL